MIAVDYADINGVGRSVCLDAGDPYTGGAGNAWVCTWSQAPNNRCYKLDGNTGQIVDTVDLPGGMNVYGCTVDSHGILWAAEIGSGDLTYFNTANTSQINISAMAGRTGRR